MLPLRINQVVKMLLGTAGVIAVAYITTLTVTTLNVTTLNATLASSTAMVVGQGTSIDGIFSTTATINPNAIAASAATSASVTLTGASTGDACSVTVTSGDFLSTTSTGRASCFISAANTASLILTNTMPTSSFDAGSSVFRIEARSY